MADKTEAQKVQDQRLEAQSKMTAHANAPSAGQPSKEDQARAAKLAEEQGERQAADPATPQSPAGATATFRSTPDEPRGGRKRRVRATQDMSHTDANGDVVHSARAGELIDEDSPLVGLHPQMFERFE